jgi:hypothetical protein
MTSTAKYYTVTLPNGEAVTRQSARNYKFAIIGRYPETSLIYRVNGSTWKVFAFCTSEEAARDGVDTLATLPKSERPLDLEIVPVGRKELVREE